MKWTPSDDSACLSVSFSNHPKQSNKSRLILHISVVLQPSQAASSMWQRTYQQPVRGTCQSAIVMDSAVQNGGFCRDSLLRVVIHNVPGFHVKRPSGAKKKKHNKNKSIWNKWRRGRRGRRSSGRLGARWTTVKYQTGWQFTQSPNTRVRHSQTHSQSCTLGKCLWNDFQEIRPGGRHLVYHATTVKMKNMLGMNQQFFIFFLLI